MSQEGRLDGSGKRSVRFPYFYHLPGIVRGKVLGGSSAVNFLAWTNPAKEDIDGILGNL